MAKIYIETAGCSHNFADSEHMAGLLNAKGNEIVDSEESADLVLFNTCTVKTPTEHSFFNKLEETKKKNRENGKNKKIVVAGCIPQTDPEKLKGYSIIGTYQIDNIVKAVEETLKGEIITLTKTDNQPSLSTPTIRQNPLIEIIPINLGCLGKCSYCKTKAARGQLKSYPKEEIIKKARSALNEGVKEIWLTSQDTAAYGQDLGTDVAELIKEICSINKDFKLRLGMGNPDNFLKIKDKLAEVMKNNPQVYKFLHLPLQSGNDFILKEMKREYSLEQYLDIVNSFKQSIPELTLATDIICGFPGETPQQFEDSVKLIQEIKPDIVNVSRFWQRGKTLAANMPNQIPNEEIMKRSEQFSSISRKISLDNKRKCIDNTYNILINEKGSAPQQWKGRTHCYKQVIIKGDYKLGQKIKVKIIDATVNDLIAEEID